MSYHNLEATTLVNLKLLFSNLSWFGGLHMQEAASSYAASLSYLYEQATTLIVFVAVFVTTVLVLLVLLNNLSPTPSSLQLSKYAIPSASAIESTWTLLPVCLLFTIVYPSLHLMYEGYEVLAQTESDSFTQNSLPITSVIIKAHQWYWQYELLPSHSHSYPLGIESRLLDSSASSYTFGSYRLLEVDNPLYLPSNELIAMRVTSSDVIHSFAVPSLGIKVDCVPGQVSEVLVSISRPGVYYGQCSEFCGSDHAFMPIKLVCL